MRRVDLAKSRLDETQRKRAQKQVVSVCASNGWDEKTGRRDHGPRVCVRESAGLCVGSKRVESRER